MAFEVVGRSDELLALAAFVEDVPSTGQALLLEGEAGIGKTSLWQEGSRFADERGLRVLRSRSSPSETRIAFATIGDLLAPVVDETLPKLVPLQRRALESALLLREAESTPPEARILGLALVSIVHALAQERPVLIAIDDVQWIDASSAEVLTFMLRRLDDEPVGVLATARGRADQAPLELDRASSRSDGCRSSRCRPERSTGCSGVGSRSRSRGPRSSGYTRGRAGTRSSPSSWAEASSTDRSGLTPTILRCPRA